MKRKLIATIVVDENEGERYDLSDYEVIIDNAIECNTTALVRKVEISEED